MARRNRGMAAESSAEDDVNLTPMLDVVFILLIFFIVTAQFIREPGPEINRVAVENLRAQNPLGILIAIDENSEIWVNKNQIEKKSALRFGNSVRIIRKANSSCRPMMPLKLGF